MTRKNLIALAVSTAVTAPAALAIDFELDDTTTFSVYGTIEPKFISEKNAAGDSESKFADEDSTLGFSVEHVFTDGITGFAQAEFEHAADSGNGLDSTDSAFLGLKGDLGSFRFGNFDSVYEDSIIDATEVAEDAQITDEAFTTEDNQIAWYSPSLGGFSVQAQLRHFGDGESANATGDAGNGISLVGSYQADIWEVHVGYDDTGSEIVDQFDANGNVTGQDFASEGTVGTSAIVSLGAFEIAGKYAVQGLEDNDPAGDDITFTAMRGTWGMGALELHAAVQQVGADVGDDRTEVAAGVEYRIYDNLKLWSEVGRFDRANDQGDNFNLGAIYSF